MQHEGCQLLRSEILQGAPWATSNRITYGKRKLFGSTTSSLSSPYSNGEGNKHLGATVIAPRGLRSSNDREDQLMTLIQISVYASAFVKQYFRNQ